VEEKVVKETSVGCAGRGGGGLGVYKKTTTYTPRKRREAELRLAYRDPEVYGTGTGSYLVSDFVICSFEHPRSAEIKCRSLR